MTEPSRPTSRRTLAGGVAAAVVVAGLGFVVGRNTSSRHAPPLPPPAQTATADTPAPAPPLPLQDPPLGRADLLNAIRIAADAVSGGSPDLPRLAALDGRRFDINLPFGCRGPGSANAPTGWRYDDKAGALRIRVTPVRFNPGDWLPADLASDVAFIEGFWIERPWTSAETCPPVEASASRPALSQSKAGEPNPTSTAAPDVTPESEETVALVEFHGANESRTSRGRDTPFQAVERAEFDRAIIVQGLRLRLKGRVAAGPRRRYPVVCRPRAGANARPVCALSMSLEQVMFESAASGSTIATWDVSRTRADE